MYAAAMKILLTTLHSKYVHASLALPYLAAYCRADGVEIAIAEYTVNEPKESVLAQIHAERADVICFSVYLWNRLETLELVQSHKLIRPEQKIVLGGPEVSFETGAFFERYPVDALICGEGEKTLRYLLDCWQKGLSPAAHAGLLLPGQSSPESNCLLDSLDEIPSPFALGLTDLKRGLVYYESSRGCPYSCSFCMSSLDDRVRSFSMERIKSDLKILIDHEVPLIKFVDRTFNYDRTRTLELFTFILEQNRKSRFHFEIGAHLFDDTTLKLLETVPDGVFQFEIGVQSTLPQTLSHVSRKASPELLARNVRYLAEKTKIHLHLDLIAGLPGEDFNHFLESIDRVCSLGADHLQIEPVKLLPGAPLRSQAERWGIQFDPNPPYTILSSDSIGFEELERLRGIGRLLDLIVNSERFEFLLIAITQEFERLSLFLDDLDRYWRECGLYRQSRSLRDLYYLVDNYLCARFSGDQLVQLRECLARDYAHHERVVAGTSPAFFDVGLTDEEKASVRAKVKEEVAQMERSGKVQYFAALFHHLPDSGARQVLIFLYLTGSGQGMSVEEIRL